MKTYSIFQEYIWLVSTLQRYGKLSLEELNGHWVRTEMSGGVPIPRTTFNRHRDAILDMPARWLDDCYGIVNDHDVPVERVVIRAYGREAHYMRDLSLHHTQREIGQGEDYKDFELTLRPTADFFTPLLSRGRFIKVLEPEWVAEDVA